jgi:hypothetical protein
MLEEIWLPIKYSEGKKEVSNFGRVRNAVTKYVLKSRLNNHGYPCISFCVGNRKYKTFNVHRLVAETFMPNYKKSDVVNHKDFDKANNNLDNLEWCTTRENVLHYFKNKFKGKVCDDDVLYIRQNIGNFSLNSLSSKFGISQNYLMGIANGSTKSTIHTDFIREKRPSIHKNVIKLDQNGNELMSYTSIKSASIANNVTLAQIQRVLNGQRKSVGGFIYKCEGYKQVKRIRKRKKILHEH